MGISVWGFILGSISLICFIVWFWVKFEFYYIFKYYRILKFVFYVNKSGKDGINFKN